MEPIDNEHIDGSIGSLKPIYWFVNYKNNSIYTGEFTTPIYYRNGGYYLYNALKVLKIPWKNLHISSCVINDGNKDIFINLEKKWEFLGKPKVLALGYDSWSGSRFL